MDAGADTPSLEILSKADAVLSVLEREHECSVQRIAEAVGEPVSSTYRLLASLTAVGLAAKGAKRGQYRLGFFPLRIGGMVEDQMDLRELGASALHELSRETGATVLLWVRRGVRAVCVDRIARSDVRTAMTRLGDSLQLWTGAAARVLLAYLPRAEAADVIASLRKTAPEPAGLEEAIVSIRASGYCRAPSPTTLGVVSIGAPIFNHRGELEAAVSINGLRQRLPDDGGPEAAVVRAAREISASLGCPESALPGLDAREVSA